MENQNVPFDPNSIPPLGGVTPLSGTMGGNLPPLQTAKPTVQRKLFANEPSSMTGWQFVGKVFLGLVIGGVVAALLFAVSLFLGGLMGGASEGPNAALGVLLAFVGFISSFLGNLGLALLYNLFFSKKYYDLGKASGLILLSSVIVFVLFLLLYLVFGTNSTALFIILGFQILFSIFIAVNLLEFVSNPNYCGSALMGNTFGFALAFLVFGVIVNQTVTSGDFNSQLLLLLLVPSIAGYPLMVFGESLWEVIYFKMYELGNNPFYLPSLAELSKEKIQAQEKEKADQEVINVDM